MMRTKAAVALEAGKPLEIMEVNLEGPKAGEVLVEIKATGICHTDEFTLSGADPEGIFPAILPIAIAIFPTIHFPGASTQPTRVAPSHLCCVVQHSST